VKSLFRKEAVIFDALIYHHKMFQYETLCQFYNCSLVSVGHKEWTTEHKNLRNNESGQNPLSFLI